MKFLFLFFLSFCGLLGCQKLTDFYAVQQNNKTATKIIDELQKSKESKQIDVVSDFSKILSLNPNNLYIQNNLGFAFDLAKDPEKASSIYHFVEEKTHDPQLKFISRFNHAQALVRQKKIKEALDWYQKALEIDPNSQMVKINIELLRQSKGQGEGEGEGEGKNSKDQSENQKDKEGDSKDDKDAPKKRQQSQKYTPREFKGEMNESDVKKILGELRQQEQKIRAEFNKSDVKESPREKDW